jgi:hypothetical protein
MFIESGVTPKIGGMSRDVKERTFYPVTGGGANGQRAGAGAVTSFSGSVHA